MAPSGSMRQMRCQQPVQPAAAFIDTTVTGRGFSGNHEQVSCLVLLMVHRTILQDGLIAIHGHGKSM